MIEKTIIQWKEKGPSLLILGAIHGDEVCWPYAIKKLLKEVSVGKISLIKWQINCVPICNPKAYSKGTRYTENNLNRVFKKHKNPKTYEEALANTLTKYVENCDYILDLHSISSEWNPFVFQDYDDDNTITFCKNIGLKHIITGRTKLDMAHENADTIGYAHSCWKIWAVVECGQHNSKKSKQIAYKSIINTLSWLWITAQKQAASEEVTSVRVKKVIIKDKAGKFSKHWKHLDQTAKGEILCIYEDWETILASETGYILLPHEGAKIGNERFYIGE